MTNRRETSNKSCLRVPAGAILRLRVRNHFGVMTHVCSLFSRRAFNLDAIICLPMGDGAESTVLLMVNENQRLDQLLRQLAKLEDVLQVSRAPELRSTFESVSECFAQSSAALTRGFQAIIPADGCTALSEELHQAGVLGLQLDFRPDDQPRKFRLT